MPFDIRHTAHALGVIVLLAMLAGCAQWPHYPRSVINTSRATVSERDPAVALLNYAHQLQAATPDQRAAQVVAARQAVDDSAGARTYAHLALAYGTPNQRRYTPDEAARYAQLALDADDANWSQAACQYLSDYARLYDTATKAQATAPAADSAAATRRPVKQETETAAHADHDRARIAQLEAELDEAHRKLRELANIEDRLGDAEP